MINVPFLALKVTFSYLFDFKNPLDLGFNFFLNSSTNQRKVNLVKQLKNVKLFFKLLSF